MDPFTRRLEVYEDLPREDRQFIAGLLKDRMRLLRPRKDLLAGGDPVHGINIILSGWAFRYKTLEDGRRQIMAFLLPGDCCDLQMYLLSRMDHSVSTLTDVTCYEASPEQRAEMMDRPAICRALTREMLVNIAIQREWTVSLGQRSAAERIGHLFCELWLRLGCIGQAEGNSCVVPLTQTELADATGMSTVHVNRTLQELRGAGLVVFEDRRLTIPDPKALMAHSLFDANYLHLGPLERSSTK